MAAPSKLFRDQCHCWAIVSFTQKMWARLYPKLTCAKCIVLWHNSLCREQMRRFWLASVNGLFLCILVGCCWQLSSTVNKSLCEVIWFNRSKLYPLIKVLCWWSRFCETQRLFHCAVFCFLTKDGTFFSCTVNWPLFISVKCEVFVICLLRSLS